MRLLFLTTSYPSRPGDFAGGFVQDLADAVAAQGHEVTVLAPHGGLYARYGVLDALRERWWLAAEIPPSLAILFARALFEARHADLVVTNWLLPCGLMGAALNRLLGKRHLAIEHGGSVRLAAVLPGGALLLAFAMRGADTVHFVSRSLRDAALRLLGPAARVELEERCTVGPMPAVPGGTAGSPPRTYAPPLRVLFAGRFVPAKGLLCLLTACAAVRSVRLTLAGDGPLRKEVEAAVDRLGLQGRVKLLGLVPRQEMRGLYAQHDVVVIPSVGPDRATVEGVPAVLLEAMAEGLAPVVSDAGGMTEIVRHGRNGLVFNALDAEELATHLRLLANSGRTTAKLAHEARLTAAKHTHAALFAQWAKRLPEFPQAISGIPNQLPDRRSARAGGGGALSGGG